MAANVKVYLKRNRDGSVESFDELLRRFKKEVLRSYVLDEYKKHEYFMSKKAYRAFKHDLYMKHTKNKKYR